MISAISSPLFVVFLTHTAQMHVACGIILGVRLTCFDYLKNFIYFIVNTNRLVVFFSGFIIAHGGRQRHLPHNWP